MILAAGTAPARGACKSGVVDSPCGSRREDNYRIMWAAQARRLRSATCRHNKRGRPHGSLERCHNRGRSRPLTCRRINGHCWRWILLRSSGSLGFLRSPSEAKCLRQAPTISGGLNGPGQASCGIVLAERPEGPARAMRNVQSIGKERLIVIDSTTIISSTSHGHGGARNQGASRCTVLVIDAEAARCRGIQEEIVVWENCKAAGGRS